MAAEAEHVGRAAHGITIPIASTRRRNLRLAWERDLRDPMYRARAVRNLVIGAAVLVGVAFWDVATALALAVSAVGCSLLAKVLTTIMWSRGRANESGLVLRPGGVEYFSPAWRTWYPTDRIVSWSLAGSGFTIEYRDIGRSTLDAAGIAVDEGTVASLLAADPEPDLEVPWHEAARWVMTATTVGRNRVTASQLAPDRLRRVAPPFLGMFALVFSASWVLAVARTADDHGWWSTIVASIPVLGELAVRSAVVSAAIVVISTVLARRKLPRHEIGAAATLLVEPASFALFREGLAPTRVAWSDVGQVRADDEWVELVTVEPRLALAFPSWAFLAGERETFLECLRRPRIEGVGGDPV